MFSLPEDIDADKFVLVGSHVDSVPSGGNFDGFAGVIAGLLCLARAKHLGLSFAKPVKVIALRGEESAWFGPCYIASKALLGKLQDSEIHALTRILNLVDFSSDFRSKNATALDAIRDLLKQTMQSVERERRVKFELNAEMYTAPALCDSQMVEGLLASMEKIKLALLQCLRAAVMMPQCLRIQAYLLP